MIGEISALSSALAIASSAVISKSLISKIAALPLQTMRCWFGAIFLIAVATIMGRIAQLTHIPLLLMGLMTASTLIGIALGDTLYLRALSMAEVSKVFPVVRGTQILSTMIIAAALFDEEVTWVTVVGAILVMTGVYLAAFAKTEDRPDTPAQPVAIRKWLPLAVIVGLCWMSSLSLMKVVLQDVDPILVNTFRLPVACLLLTSLVLRSGQGKSLKVVKYGRTTLGLVATGGILSYAIGVSLELYAVHYAGITKAAILTSWTPLFILFFSVLFLREKLTFRLGLGTLLCSGGTVLLVVL